MSVPYSQTPLQNDGILQDHSIKSTAVSDNGSSSLAHQKARIEFPWKLHQLLDDAEQNIFDRKIVSWLPNGRAFKIHNKIKFSSEVMPLYFRTTTYKSFHRNLNMWGFETVRQRAHKGACYNSLFVRGHPDGCYLMKRTKIKDRSTPDRRTSISLVTGMMRPATSITPNPVSWKNDPTCQSALPLVSMPLGSPAAGAVSQGPLVQILARSHAEMAMCDAALGPQSAWRLALASSAQTETTLAPQTLSLLNVNVQNGSRQTIDHFVLATTLDILCGRGVIRRHPSAW